MNTNKQIAALATSEQTQQFIEKTNQGSYLPAHVIQVLLEETGLDRETLGLSLLPIAAEYATAPISQFKVGAVAFDSEGNGYFGANFEFSGDHIGQTVHAEQSAIAHMWQRGAKDLDLLVINYPPCGHCRQFINEINITKNFQIQLPETKAKPFSYYLPDDFSGTDLGIQQKILHTVAGSTTTNSATLRQLAQHAHDTCHAPYSGNKNGIALQFSDGEIFTGRYAENAAFNPSLPALQVALNSRRLQGKAWKDIIKAVMVESDSGFQQHNNTKALLSYIAPNATLEYHHMPRALN